MYCIFLLFSGESESQKTPPQILNRWQNITNLSAGISYEIRVVAKSGDYQAASNWKKITIPSLREFYLYLFRKHFHLTYMRLKSISGLQISVEIALFSESILKCISLIKILL